MFRKKRKTELKNERWAGIAKQLVEYLENFQKQQEFLRAIDKHIINSRGGETTELLQFVVEQVHSLLPVSRASFYLIRGANAVLEVSSSQDNQPQRVIPLEEFESCFCEWVLDAGLWESSDHERCLLAFQGTTVLAVPARREKQTLGLLLVECNQEVRFSQLAELEVCRFLTTVAGQAAVALKFHEQLAAEARLWNFASRLHDNPFDSMESVNRIASDFREFLPSCEGDCTGDHVYVQILFLERPGEEDVLTIRGSTDPDRNPGLTQVDINDSVCGLLIKNENQPYLLCDPQDEDFRGLYKHYLGKKDGGLIRCELAIPLEHAEGRRFAVINLESTQKNAFNLEKVQDYVEKAKLFTPILYSIKTRIESHALTQVSTLQALESYLGLISKQYLHSLRTPYLDLRQGLLLLEGSLSNGAEKDLVALKHMQLAATDIYTLQNGFASDINDFASPKRHDMKKLIEGAMALLNQPALKKDNNIVIKSDLCPGIWVECSLFMKQVFYNIIHNAITWLDKKRLDKPEHQGVITVSLELPEISMEGEEENLNRFCKIHIHDNGLGVLDEHREQILNNTFTLRGEGTGFGLYAANQYVLSLGGKLLVESVYGESFSVTINLRTVALQV